MSPFKPDTFRRSWQTWAHNNQTPARTIADIAGHAGVNMQFTYVQSLEQRKKEPVFRIAESLKLHSGCTVDRQDGEISGPAGRWAN